MEIQLVAGPRLKRLDEHVSGGNVEDQRLGYGAFGFGRFGHDLISNPEGDFMIRESLYAGV